MDERVFLCGYKAALVGIVVAFGVYALTLNYSELAKKLDNLFPAATQSTTQTSQPTTRLNTNLSGLEK